MGDEVQQGAGRPVHDAGVEEMWTTPMCVDAVSKDLTGQMRLDAEASQGCRDARRCGVSKRRYRARFEVSSHAPCDASAALPLDGSLAVRDLVVVLPARGAARGPHRGTFVWTGSGLVVEGGLTGTTNVGTHRRPAFAPCQECDAPDTLEGQLEGVVVRAEDPRLHGRTVTAAYELSLEPSVDKDRTVSGTLEGVLVRACRDLSCVDLTAAQAGLHPNPWTIDGHTVEVLDLHGNPLPGITVGPVGGRPSPRQGIHLGRSAVLTLAAPTGYVAVTLEDFVQPPTLLALDASGVTVAAARPARTPSTATLTAAGITTVVVTSPQDETWLTGLCVASTREPTTHTEEG